MGYSLHFASRYEIKYEGQFFSNKWMQFNRFAKDNFTTAWLNEEDPEFANEIELDRVEIAAFIEKYRKDLSGLKEMIAGKYENFIEPDHLLNILDLIQKESDQQNSFIRLSWY